MKSTLSLLAVALLTLSFASSASAADAKEIYAKKCAMCHGADGKPKKATMKDLTDAKVQAAATDAQWEKDIVEGVKADGKVVMPPTKGITADDAKELVKVCRSFKK
jgi:cytochrome c551/c552